MGHMIDSAGILPSIWWDAHKSVIDTAVVYIGGPRCAARHTPYYAYQLKAQGFKILGCYVGYQARDINAGDPNALALIDIANAERRQYDFGLTLSPIAWDFEQSTLTPKIHTYLDTIASKWAKDRHPKRLLYSSASLLGQYHHNDFAGYWRASYTRKGYTPGLTTADLALQYAGNVRWDNANVDISAYHPTLFEYKGKATGYVMEACAMWGTPTDKGYTVVNTDGGVFCYGDAEFHGSLGGKPLNAPIIGGVPTSTGKGYWLLGKDNGIFAFGDAPYFDHPHA